MRHYIAAKSKACVGPNKEQRQHLSRVMKKTVLLYANNKGADQPAHPRSLISAFVVRCLVSIIPLVSISKISSLYLASLAAQGSAVAQW